MQTTVVTCEHYLLSTRFNTCPPYFKVESKITHDFTAQCTLRCLENIGSVSSLLKQYEPFGILLHGAYISILLDKFIEKLNSTTAKIDTIDSCGIMDLTKNSSTEANMVCY